MLRCPPEEAVSQCCESTFGRGQPSLTEPENMGRGVPGLEPWCMFLELGPLGRGNGV